MTRPTTLAGRARLTQGRIPKEGNPKACDEKCQCRRHSARMKKLMQQVQKLSPTAKAGYIWTNNARSAQSTAQQGRRHTVESRIKMSITRIGHSTSEESNEKRSLSMRNHIADCDGSCGSGACKAPLSPTGIENILVNLLLHDFPTVEREKRFGPYRVDAYLPEYHLAFEADGEYWHSTERDVKRDAELLEQFGLHVIRFTGSELNKIGGVLSLHLFGSMPVS